jgi:hypothetical protein
LITTHDEKPKLTIPRSHIREKATAIEKDNMSGHPKLPETHDDYLGIQKMATRHRKE